MLQLRVISPNPTPNAFLQKKDLSFFGAAACCLWTCRAAKSCQRSPKFTPPPMVVPLMAEIEILGNLIISSDQIRQADSKVEKVSAFFSAPLVKNLKIPSSSNVRFYKNHHFVSLIVFFPTNWNQNKEILH